MKTETKKNSLKDVVRYYRGEKGMTQQALATQAGMSLSTLYGIEAGKTLESMNLSTLRRLFKVLELKVGIAIKDGSEEITFYG